MTDWPLGLCDPKSIDASLDLEPTDLVFAQSMTETMNLYWRSSHRWYYLSHQLPTEATIFRQADCRESPKLGKEI